MEIIVFISVDPLADKYPGWGGYVYCGNNPLLYTDPTGEYYFDKDGKKIGDFGSKDKNYIVTNKKEVKAMRNDNNFDTGTLQSQKKLASQRALSETEKVFVKTYENGGTREEGTLVGKKGNNLYAETGPDPTLNNGKGELTFKNVKNTKQYEASIHSHPLKAFEYGGDIKAFDITASDNDKEWFGEFDTNIIAGKSRELNTDEKSEIKDFGSDADSRKDYVSFYDSEGNERIKISRKLLNDILEEIEK